MSYANYTVGNNSSTSTYYEKVFKNGDNTPPHILAQGRYTENNYTTTRESQVQNAVSLYKKGDVTTAPYYKKFVFLDSQSVVFRNDYSEPNFADVVSRLGEKWRGTSLNLAMYVSPEGRESVEMVYGSLMKIGRCALSLKRGDFGGAVRNLNEMPRRHVKRAARRFNQGDLSGSFLAMHLGWTPLIKDVYEASQPISFGERGQSIHARRASTPATWYLKNARPTEVLKAKMVGSVTLKGVIGRSPTWSQALGLTNPALVAWELVPLSFVADYFLPIGATIDSLGVITQARFSKLFKCVYKATEVNALIPAQTEMMTVNWRNSAPARLYLSRISYTRTNHVLSFSDVLPMKVTIPTSVMRLSTLAALTHQRILALR